MRLMSHQLHFGVGVSSRILYLKWQISNGQSGYPYGLFSDVVGKPPCPKQLCMILTFSPFNLLPICLYLWFSVTILPCLPLRLTSRWNGIHAPKKRANYFGNRFQSCAKECVKLAVVWLSLHRLYVPWSNHDICGVVIHAITVFLIVVYKSLWMDWWPSSLLGKRAMFWSMHICFPSLLMSISKNRQQPTLSFHLLISHQLSLLITLLQLFRIHLVEPRLIHRVVEDRPVESILCWHPVWLGNTSWWRLSHDCGERCTRGVLIPFGKLTVCYGKIAILMGKSPINGSCSTGTSLSTMQEQ